jgi:hypothetical protein
MKRLGHAPLVTFVPLPAGWAGCKGIQGIRRIIGVACVATWVMGLNQVE